MILLKGATFAVGLALLAATAHVTITATGGYGAPHAVLTLAIALGVGVAALAIGAAWSAGRTALAAWLLVAIVAGEAFGCLMTAERLIVGREAAQAPLRAAEDERGKAMQRVADAAAALTATPATSPRLEAALGAKAAADATVVLKSAERGCLVNCRALLQAQVDTALVEIAEARREIAALKTAAEGELASARAALAGVKAPASATPLADRVGIAAWIVDLVTAALGSIAANGLGAGLIAFAAHHRRREVSQAHAPAAVEPEIVPSTKLVVRDREHAAQFALEALEPAAGEDGADLLAVHDAYRRWCLEKNVEALPAARIGQALAVLFDGTGITLAERDGRRVALGVTVRDHASRAPKRRALGHMAARVRENAAV